MKRKELIKLDLGLLEPLNNDQMLVVKGGICVPCIVVPAVLKVIEIIITTTKDDVPEANNCNCNNCSNNCPNS
jgi:hypothetical protein